MGFFNEETAYMLQFITFPLEVIGLSLALIEVRFPNLSKTIASYVISEADQINQTRRIERPAHDTDRWLRKEIWYWANSPQGGFAIVTLGFLFLVLANAFLTALIFDLSVDSWMELIVETFESTIVGTFTEGLVFFVPIALVTFAVYASANWIEDRVVGTLGVFIAGIGVAGEAYQFTTQLVT